MDTSDIVWLVVAIIVVFALLALLVGLMRKRKEKKGEQARLQAEQLRREAAAGAGGITRSQVSAQQAETDAERARLEAERAEAQAAEARQGLRQEEAQYEDRLREADRLDPDVNTKAKDYDPGRTSPSGPTDPEYDDGSSRVR